MMNTITLQRTWQDNTSTIGMFLFQDIKICDSLEPSVLKRLPEGRYELLLTPSPTLDYDVLYIMTPAPKKGYEIHRGNTVNDTRGCPLCGWLSPRLINTLQFSKEALDLLCSLHVNRGALYLEIKDI